MNSPFVHLATLKVATCIAHQPGHGETHAVDRPEADQAVDRLLVALPTDWLLILYPGSRANRGQGAHRA
ncbi:hypothetical protein ABIE67_000313 [Streptomyces sp. V4I8]